MISENVIENVKRGKEIGSLGYTFLTPKQNSLLTEYINKVIKKRNVKQFIIKKKRERDNLKVKLKKEKGDNKTELITVRLRAIEEATKEIDNLNEEYESVKFVQFNNKERQALFRIKQKISDFLGKTTEIKEISIILDLLEQNP